MIESGKGECGVRGFGEGWWVEVGEEERAGTGNPFRACL